MAAAVMHSLTLPTRLASSGSLTFDCGRRSKFPCDRAELRFSRGEKKFRISALDQKDVVSAAHVKDSEQKQGPPVIELEFIGPNPGENGAGDKASVISGEKLLRNIMLDNKIELYGLYGKVMNCGGGGSCGTCLVEILEGGDLLNERTDTEYRYLKKNPESWRLACQTIVGNKSNSGKVVVQRFPQKKKK